MVGINLIPEHVRWARARRRRLVRWATAVVLSLATLTIPLGIEWYFRARAEVLREEQQRLQAELAAVRTQLTEANREQTALASEIERARALRSKRSWSGLFALLGQCLPRDAWLTAVATDPATPPAQKAQAGSLHQTVLNLAGLKGKPEPAGPSIITIEAPRKLRLEGYTGDYQELYAFIALLKQTGAFAEVQQGWARTEQVDRRSVVSFEVICTW